MWTAPDGTARVLAEAVVRVAFGATRTIESAVVDPEVGDPTLLVGSGPGRGFRKAIAAAFPLATDRSSLAYFLVEDLTTTPLLSTFALSRRAETQGLFVELSSGPVSAMEGVCAGYRPGGLAMELRRQNSQRSQNVAVISAHRTDDTEAAWYGLAAPEGLSMCRRRLIDVWPDADGFRVEAGFRDQSWELDGREAVVHEYELQARIGAGQPMTLDAVAATPRVIPYPDCPGAANEIDRLVGLPLAQLRERVLEELRGVESCTHLNDMIRALAELPDLVDATAAPEEP